MRKTLSFYETKTLESKTAPLHPSFSFYTIFLCKLELVVEGRACPCTEVGILLKSRKNYVLVPVPLSVVPVPGTGTTWLLVISCFGVPVPVCLVPVPLPLQMFPNTIALPKTSQQRLPSSAMIYIRSLDTNPYNNYARNPKNLHKSKTRERSKAPILIQNESKI